MKTLIILLLFPLYSYSQNIGEILTNKDNLVKIEKPHCYKYVYTSNDSIITINTRKSDDLIWDINYVISRQSNLSWITKYSPIGRNIFYNNGSYYFITITEKNYLIQVRNVSKVWAE